MRSLLLTFAAFIFGFKSANGITAEEFIKIGLSNSCIYLSRFAIWPYPLDEPDKNYAEQSCNEIGLSLASLTEQENFALREFSRCTMKLKSNQKVLIGFNSDYNPSNLLEGKKCYFQNHDGSHSADDEDNCVEGMPGEPVYFACSKPARCSSMPSCNHHTYFPSKCDITLSTGATHSSAVQLCKGSGGILPVYTYEHEHLQWTYGTIWLALTTDAETLEDCNGMADCMSKTDFYWDQGSDKPREPLSNFESKLQGGRMVVSGQDRCFAHVIENGYKMIKNVPCETKALVICSFTTGSVESPSNAPPDTMVDSATCKNPMDAPSGTNLELDVEEGDLFCVGSEINYACNAGGVNVRQDDNGKSNLKVNCGSDLNFDYPNPWPTCTDRLDCPTPFLDAGVMEYTWTPGGSLTPEFTIDYSCVWPGKYIISKEDLDNGIDTNLLKSITIQCQLNGTYDINIEDWTCTKPCPIPTVPDPTIMKQDWPKNDTKPEIFEENRHSCLDGRHLVSKSAFSSGIETNFFDDIMSSCQVTGWMNETIGAFTCTTACPTEGPANFTERFTHDWDASKGTDIGLTVNYQCNNPIKKVLNLKEENAPLFDQLPVTCLYNGQYDKDITEYGCTECVRRPDPPNGKLKCESPRYEEDSSCFLQCNKGYIPLGKTVMTCQKNEEIQDFEWDLDESEFACVRPIGLVIGGQTDTLRYSDTVEIFAPGFACSKRTLAALPMPIYGASAAFINGHAIVCGGATEIYKDCRKDSDNLQKCQRNVECVKTLGGAQWCTGPKTDACYSFDPILSQSWTQVTALKKARSNAASTVSFAGVFWIFGGAGKSGILNTVEKLTVTSSGKWKVYQGPKMPSGLLGSCAAPLNKDEILVMGGFSTLINDYIDIAYILSTSTYQWSSKSWARLRNGPRLDASCASVNWYDARYLLVAGGWNNYATNTTEMMLDGRFQSITQRSITGEVSQPLPLKLRSSVLTELNDMPFLIGGVICTGNQNARQVCQRSDKVFGLTPTPGLENITNAYWQDYPAYALTQKKSGHALLSVPKSYVPQCALL